MEKLRLKPVTITPKIITSLEKRDLIRTFTPTKKIVHTKKKDGAVEKMYSSSPAHGTHKVICVGKRTTAIRPGYHSGNEEFILINNTSLRYKPLFLIVGLSKRRLIEKKARTGTLKAADFMALKLRYNDFSTSVFTMLKETLHCEVTVPGKGLHPIFFVCEPGRLSTKRGNLGRYRLELH